MNGLAAELGEEKTVMIDATYLKAHRTATSMGVKRGGGRGRLIGRTKGGINTVRRESFWNQELRKLIECSAHLFDLIMLRVDCDASGALLTSSV